MATQPKYHVFNRYKEQIHDVTDHESANIIWKWKDIGSGTIVIPGTPPPELLVPALNVHNSPLFVSAYTDSAVPWTGRVSNGEYVDDGDGPALELTLVNDRIWLDAMLAVANPNVSPGLQDREFDVREGPLETVVKQYLSAAAARLKLPIVVVPPRTDDASPIVNLSARMVPMTELFKDALELYGYTITARTYRVGDQLPEGLQSFAPEPGWVMLDVQPPRDRKNLVWQQEQLSEFSVSSSEPRAYQAYVGADGEGAARKFYFAIDQERRDAAAPFGLPEVYVDLQKDQTVANGAKAALDEVAGGLSVNFTVENGNPWRLGDDWEVGDFAHARIAGEVFRAQITEVEMSDASGSPVTYTPKCGVADPGRPEAVADALARLVAELKARDARR